MEKLQELVSRARLVFSDAPGRLEIFKLINGKSTAKEISLSVGRSFGSTSNDIKKMVDMGLIEPRKLTDGSVLKKNGSILYRKVPELLHISISYFNKPTKLAKTTMLVKKRQRKNLRLSILPIPDEKAILDICQGRENQIYEFKAAGTDVQHLAREVAAFSNTKKGGHIFYGVDDAGIVTGSDKNAQQIDQPLQNLLRSKLTPNVPIRMIQKNVLGKIVVIISTPAWNKKEPHYFDEKIYIRQGTNAFPAKPDVQRKLHKGEYVF